MTDYDYFLFKNSVVIYTYYPLWQGSSKKVAFFSDFNNLEINRVNCGFFLKKLGWVVHA